MQGSAGYFQCLRAFSHALLERVIQFAQLFLDPAALGYFGNQSTALPVQFDKDGNLRAEDSRVYRLDEIVHRAGPVAFEHMLVFVVVGGQEDDRHPGGLLPLLDHLGQFEPIHAGQPDIQDEESEFFHDERVQRLIGGSGPDQPVVWVVEDGFEHGEIFRFIVDDQDVDGTRVKGGRWSRGSGATLGLQVLHLGVGRRRVGVNVHGVTSLSLDLVHLNSHTRISDKSWSVLTGLAM